MSREERRQDGSPGWGWGGPHLGPAVWRVSVGHGQIPVKCSIGNSDDTFSLYSLDILSHYMPLFFHMMALRLIIQGTWRAPLFLRPVPKWLVNTSHSE